MNDANSSSQSTGVIPRPRRVTCLAWGVLTIAVLNLLRFGLALNQWDFLESIRRGLPLYQALSGLTWGAAGLAAAWALWFGRRWGMRLTLGLALLGSMHLWGDRLWLANRSSVLDNWFFMLAATLLLLTLTAWAALSRKSRRFFR